MKHRPSALRPSIRVPLLGLAALLTACGGGGGAGSAGSSGGGGGGGGPPPNTAVQVGLFNDGPVVNLNYASSPSGLSGSTDVRGAFTFKVGDTVTFSYGGLTLGSVKPAINGAGTAVITPLSLTGETDPTNAPKATALARLVYTLDLVSTADGFAISGDEVLPLASDAAAHTTSLFPQLVALGSAQSTSAAGLQAVFDAVYGSGTYTVWSDPSAQAALGQAVFSSAVAGTVWTGTVATTVGSNTTSTGLYAYFSPDMVFDGFDGNGNALRGAWALKNDGSVQVFSSGSGQALASGLISVGTTTMTGGGVDSSGNTTVWNASEVSQTGLSANTWTGAWYASLTPAAGGPVAGSAFLVVDPTGKVYGLLNDGTSSRVFSGSADLAAGTGTAVVNGTTGLSFSFDFSKGTGSEASNAVVQDNLALSRTGTF